MRVGPGRRVAGSPRVPVLVTGFGPFPGVPDSPSEVIVRRLGEIAGVRLVRRRLATEWRCVEDVPSLIGGARIAVHIGVAPSARRLRIETTAVDARQRAPDAAGALPAGSGTGGRVRRARAKAAPLVAAARRRGVEAGISGDAGRYLCNAVYFRSLTAAETAARPPMVLFVHVPPTAPMRGRRLEHLVAAVESVIAALVAQTRPQRPLAQPKSRSRAE